MGRPFGGGGRTVNGEKRMVASKGGGCIFWSPLWQEFYMPTPSFIHPPPLEGHFQGCEGGMQFGPVRIFGTSRCTFWNPWIWGSVRQTPRKGFFTRGLCKNVRLSWLWRSECQMYCWTQCSWVLSVLLGVALDSAETPFAKTPPPCLGYWVWAWDDCKPRASRNPLNFPELPRNFPGSSPAASAELLSPEHPVRVVNFLRAMNLLSHCDALSRRTMCGHDFPENYRHVFLSKKGPRRSKYVGGGGE